MARVVQASEQRRQASEQAAAQRAAEAVAAQKAALSAKLGAAAADHVLEVSTVKMQAAVRGRLTRRATEARRLEPHAVRLQVYGRHSPQGLSEDHTEKASSHQP